MDAHTAGYVQWPRATAAVHAPDLRLHHLHIAVKQVSAQCAGHIGCTREGVAARYLSMLPDTKGGVEPYPPPAAKTCGRANVMRSPYQEPPPLTAARSRRACTYRHTTQPHPCIRTPLPNAHPHTHGNPFIRGFTAHSRQKRIRTNNNPTSTQHQPNMDALSNTVGAVPGLCDTGSPTHQKSSMVCLTANTSLGWGGTASVTSV
jgi:hypothetical protein